MLHEYKQLGPGDCVIAAHPLIFDVRIISYVYTVRASSLVFLVLVPGTCLVPLRLTYIPGTVPGPTWYLWYLLPASASDVLTAVFLTYVLRTNIYIYIL